MILSKRCIQAFKRLVPTGCVLLYCFSLTFVGVGKLHGQPEKQRDSLLFELKYADDDAKLAIAKDFSHQLYKYYPQEVLTVLNEELAGVSASVLDSADIFHFKAIAYYYTGDFDAYYSNRERSISLRSKYQGPENEHYYYVSHLHQSLNAIHANLDGEPDKAMQAYLLSNEFADKSGDAKSKVRANIDLGSYFMKNKIYDDAVKHLKLALKHNTLSSYDLQSLRLRTYAKLATAYNKLNAVDSSEHYLSLIPPEEYDFYTCLTSATILYKKEQYIDAITLIDSLLNDKVELAKGPDHWLPYLQLLKGANLYQLKNYESAEQLWLACRLAFLKLKDNDNLADVSKKLYAYYRQRGQFEKALIFHEEHKAISDSILYRDNKTVLEGIYAKSSLSEEKTKNKLLRQAELIQEATIDRQRFWTFSGFAIAIFSVILAMVYFRSAKKRRELNTNLQQSNRLLGRKNQEVSFRVDELNFITENLPEGIGRLDHKLRLIYHNRHLESLFRPDEKIKSENLFHVLELPEEETEKYQSTLLRSGEIAFTWSPGGSQKVFQVLITSNAPEQEHPEYIMVLQDVTELNNKAGREVSTVLVALSKMEESMHINGIKRKELTSSLTSINKELAARVIQEVKRKAEIEEVVESLKKIYKSSSSKTKLQISKVIGQLTQTLDQDNYWQTFITYFKGVHPLFLDSLKNIGSDLSNNEVRHCTFIKLGLSNREVADMLKVSPKTVEVARYRIKKKLNLEKDTCLYEYIRTIAYPEQMELLPS